MEVMPNKSTVARFTSPSDPMHGISCSKGNFSRLLFGGYPRWEKVLGPCILRSEI